MGLASKGNAILVVSANGMGKRTLLDEFTLQKRGGKGILYYKVTEKTGGIVTFKVTRAEQDLLLITSAGIIIRTPVESISQLGRITSGVKLISLDEGVSIVSAALAKREDEAPEQNEDA